MNLRRSSYEICLHGQKTTSVLLKLFINGNEKCNINDSPKRMKGNIFKFEKKNTIHEDQIYN